MIPPSSRNNYKKTILFKPNLKLLITEDGSSSLLNTTLNDYYHSTKGAIGESLYVYIEQGIDYYIKTNSSCKHLKVFEIGFGTGLNALLAINWTQKNPYHIDYESIEPHPVPKAIYTQLQFKNWSLNLAKIHKCEWEIPQNMTEAFKLTKFNTPLEKFENKCGYYNVIFFDAFSPSKQPNIWHLSNLEKCFACLKKNGFLVTYCAQGQFKRDLKEIGFEIETLPGAMGKWEMVRAQKVT